MNMSEREWRIFADAKGLDPITGSRLPPLQDPDEELIQAQFDEWADNMRAVEAGWAEAHKPPAPKKWRLRWVQE